MIKILFVLLVSINTFQIFAQNTVELKQKIEQIIASKKADIGVSIFNIEKKETLNFNGNKHYPMLSVFKFPIALTVLNKIDKGELALNQKLFISKSELLEKTWSPFREKYPNGDISITLKEALQWTVSQSDNNLCDVLIKLIGGVKAVDDFINSSNFVMKNNEKEMHENWDAQFINTITPNYSNKLLSDLMNGKILSYKSTQFLYNTMVQTSVGQKRIKGKLPLDTEVAHRTGSSFTNEKGLTGAINDIGIVTLPTKEHYIISVYIHNTNEEFEDNEEIIAKISKATWDYYIKKQ